MNISSICARLKLEKVQTVKPNQVEYKVLSLLSSTAWTQAAGTVRDGAQPVNTLYQGPFHAPLTVQRYNWISYKRCEVSI